ncbi:MAG: nitroreductase family protein [Clostridiaceae bacterium]|nr:nitroreductase family protein [Eubacteriales bacterium]
MELMTAIEARRSIRRFKNDPLPRETILSILDAARLAPSGKNMQPWRFIVVQNKARKEMADILHTALENRRAGGVASTGSAENTFRIMAEAAATVFVFSRRDVFHPEAREINDYVTSLVDAQSIGGAIEHMLLRATELHIGSLWIADTFFAYPELCAWLEEDSLLLAAVSLGYADEAPEARPRRTLEKMVKWQE